MKHAFLFRAGTVVLAVGTALNPIWAAGTAPDYPIRAAEKTKVRVTRGFWFDRLETNSLRTVYDNFAKCEETRIPNFRNAAIRAQGTFRGIPFDDSDVYKVIEGAAYTVALTGDRKLEAYTDELIGWIAAAQERDGYLYTARTLGHQYGRKKFNSSATWIQSNTPKIAEDDPAITNQTEYGMMGPTRWSAVHCSHELYNTGHLIEGAVAWYEATGKTNLLVVARKAADLIARTFGPAPDQLRDPSGHEEIELALCKLYRATGERRYLDLARHFVDVRGRESDRHDNAVFTQAGDLENPNEMELRGSYRQNHLPFSRQREAVGHAVRAGYLYCGAADVAALTGDATYGEAIEAIWENVVSRKLHLTGGVGARPKGEAFGAAYELPNDSGKTYLETCAAIGNALWNERMFRRTGQAKYVDVLERVIYNGFLSGVSLSGDEYFYLNPLASKGGYKRSKWFGCSCCPVNDVRFIPQIPSFAYATDGKGTIYWNLFMEGTVEIAGAKLSCKTDYPWNGKAVITLDRLTAQSLNRLILKVRIPGWAKGRPVPSDLYVQTVPSRVMEVSVAVNGQAANGVPGEDGYLTIGRAWKAGDTIELNLPMPVKRIRAHEKVEADRGRLAVERGPIVYCAEGFDNGGKAYDATLPEDTAFTDDTIMIGDKTFPALKASNGLKLIPYCLWDNREPGNEMQCWFRTSD